MLLSDLRIGERAVITRFNGGEPDYRRHLLMFGAAPGAVVEVIRPAPLGDPLEILVCGSMVSVRRFDAEIIEVEKIC